MTATPDAYVDPGDLPTDPKDAYDPGVIDELRSIGARYPHKRSGLLPMLHLLQSVDGAITPQGIEVCADLLEISAAEVSGVATFYTMYKRRQVGEYLVGVCTNTLCAVMGGDEIFDRVCSHLDVGNDETTEDGSITLERIECNAACDYAPVMMVNWEFVDNQTPESAVELVDRLRSGEEVRSTRGPVIQNWRHNERVLAGFPDGLVDDGPAAGPASLEGLKVADEHGWHAPPMDGSGADEPAGAEADNADAPGDAQPTADKAEAAASEADTSRAEAETTLDGAVPEAREVGEESNSEGADE